MTERPRPTRADRAARPLIAAVLSLALAACDSSNPAAPGPLNQDLARALSSTSAYRDVAAALADGFAQAGPCVAAPGLGAMGFHYVNFSRMALPPDAAQPQALLYVPEGGGLRLVGVEYIAAVIQDGRPYTGTSAPARPQPAPALFGRAYDGPSAPRSPGAPWQYELHAWIWQDNPAGRFAPFNPAVSC